MVEFRPIGPQDREAFHAFVQRLSPESRTNRFMSPVRELAPSALDALTQPDQSRHIGLVAHEGAEIVGEGRYVVLGGSDHGEFAIAVADRWQRQGLGARLLRALTTVARRAGVAVLEGEIMRTNVAMLRFIQHAGFRLKACPGDGRLTIAERNLSIC